MNDLTRIDVVQRVAMMKSNYLGLTMPGDDTVIL